MTTKQLLKAFLWTILLCAASSLGSISFLLFDKTHGGWIFGCVVCPIIIVLSALMFFVYLYDSDKS